ncbi:farnesol dehydrogenase-like [Hylaeus anthracinus]|uniref:farnesol dehydrogenase-like n=1 Tax=Hylaeus volcanicus TaxID=313075 RepID=UPI0023B7CD09|nr:farnesol dehydrogenase-like [Hylaeus volcanicus]XP_054012755.1 farnesol dehydrogenase-like [Hylaeus anthracinus]XP_054012756.1 farnesol dehydrogenase-like [Hylaeus anthracinus]
MDRWVGKTAIVTGAASGIGEAITAALLLKKVNVLALDIQAEKLLLASTKWEQIVERGEFCILDCDISEEKDVERAFTLAQTNWGGVDIMVNNAGVINYTRVIESDRAAFERLLNINILATAVFINRAVRSMRQRNVEGHIFNINSVLGHEIPSRFLSEIDGCNGWNLYPTCKHGTVALTHTVRRELAAVKAPIRITSICPGLVHSGIATNSPEVDRILAEIPSLQPQDVADGLMYALGTRPEVQITELVIQRTGEM